MNDFCKVMQKKCIKICRFAAIRMINFCNSTKRGLCRFDPLWTCHTVWSALCSYYSWRFLQKLCSRCDVTRQIQRLGLLHASQHMDSVFHRSLTKTSNRYIIPASVGTVLLIQTAQRRNVSYFNQSALGGEKDSLQDKASCCPQLVREHWPHVVFLIQTPGAGTICTFLMGFLFPNV